MSVLLIYFIAFNQESKIW